MGRAGLARRRPSGSTWSVIRPRSGDLPRLQRPAERGGGAARAARRAPPPRCPAAGRCSLSDPRVLQAGAPPPRAGAAHWRRQGRAPGRGAAWAGAPASGCYGLTLAGLVVPPRLLARPVARRFAELVPVALLAALIAVQTLTSGQSLQADPARLAGMAAAVAALLARLPFLAVIVAAAGTAALIRLC